MIFQDNNTFFARIVGNNLRVRPTAQTIRSQTIKNRATQFIQDQSRNQYLTTLFRTSLKRQLQNQVDSISTLSDSQIRRQTPFLFNSQQVPDVFRSIAVGAALNIPITSVDIQRMDISTVNGICDRMIEKAVKDLDPKLNQVLQKYRRVALDYGIFTNQQKYIALDLFSTVMKKLKMYGQLVINGHYLQTYGQKQFQNGKYYYNIIEIPHLQFEFTNSKLTIYQKKNGIRFVVQPKQFNYEFIKGLLKGIQLLKNTGVMKSFNNYLLPVQQQRDLNAFRQRYLN